MEDHRLLALLEQRNEDVLAELQNKYGAKCFYLALGLLHDKQLAEECVNDVWLKLWDSIPPARPNHLWLYIAKATRNTALTCLEKQQAQKRSATVLLLDELREVIPDPLYEQETDGEALRTLLEDFLRELKPEHRRLFLRRYWYGQEVRQLAKEWNTTEGRLSGILFRLRKKLRKRLEKEGFRL